MVCECWSGWNLSFVDIGGHERGIVSDHRPQPLTLTLTDGIHLPMKSFNDPDTLYLCLVPLFVTCWIGPRGCEPC